MIKKYEFWLLVVLILVYVLAVEAKSEVPNNQLNKQQKHSEKIIALTLLMEARGEGIKGMMMVAQVINNRAIERGMSLTQICLQPKQFSCWNGINNSNLIYELQSPKYSKLLLTKEGEIALGIAREMVIGFKPFSSEKKYNHYHNTSVSPKWAANKKGYTEGKHVFYCLK
jgi:spore germination cell wall hydrolase CwlJ-like protein